MNVKVNTYIQDKLKNILIQVNENIKIKDLIKLSINAFNSKLEVENLNFRFNVEYDKYNLKQSKKNGLPKDDLPCMIILI